MRSIAICVPSRSRPEVFNRMVDSAFEMACEPEGIEIRAYLDDDDPTVKDYDLSRVKATIGERMRTPVVHEKLAMESDADILMLIGDDSVFDTKCWDELLCGAFNDMPDGIGVAYCNSMNGRDIPEHVICSSKWRDVAKPFMFTQFEHFYVDTIMIETAKACGRLWYLKDIDIEHAHAKYGKALWDDSYKSKRGALHQRDTELFQKLAPEIRASVQYMRNLYGLEASAA